MSIGKVKVGNIVNNFFELSVKLNQYISRVQKAIEHSLWIRDTYSTSSYRQPLALQPIQSTVLEIYPNDSTDIPINGIKERAYQDLNRLFQENFEEGSIFTFDSNLSKELRDCIKMDLIILLSRPTSRELLFILSHHHKPVKFTEGKETFYEPEKQVVYFEQLEMQSVISRERKDKKNAFFAPMPRFILIAHELIHLLHERLYGANFNKQFKRYPPTLDENYDDLREQFVITGDGGGKTENLSINEQQICREFGIPYREDHHHGGQFSPDISLGHCLLENRLPIQYAALNGAMLNVVHWLKTGGDVNLKLSGQRTLLHEASKGRSYHIAAFLIGKGAQIEAVDNEGNTPLHECARSNQAGIGTLLLKQGAQVDRKNQGGKTPLFFASRLNPQLGLILLERGAQAEESFLLGSIATGDVEFVKKLLDLKMEIPSFMKNSLFRQAVKEEKYEMARFLLCQGAEIDSQPFNSIEGTVLQEVIYLKRGSEFKWDKELTKERIRKATFLLDNGASSRLPDAWGNTPFHHAYQCDDGDILSLLHQRDSGGHLIKNAAQKSVYDYLLENQREDLLPIFLKASP